MTRLLFISIACYMQKCTFTVISVFSYTINGTRPSAVKMLHGEYIPCLVGEEVSIPKTMCIVCCMRVSKF